MDMMYVGVVLPVDHDSEGHQGAVDGGEPLPRVPPSQHQLGAGEGGVDLPPVEDGGDVAHGAALPGDEVVPDHLGGGPPFRHGQPELVALRVVDFIQEVHAVVGDSGQENTEGCLEAGGSSSGEAHTDHLNSLGHLRLGILTITGSNQDLLEVVGNRDLLDAPILTEG